MLPNEVTTMRDALSVFTLSFLLAGVAAAQEAQPAPGKTARAWLAETVAAARADGTLPQLLAPRGVEATTGDNVVQLRCTGQETDAGIAWSIESLQDGRRMQETLTIDAEGRLAACTLTAGDGEQQETMELAVARDGLRMEGEKKALPWTPECISLDLLVFALLPRAKAELPAGLTVSLGGLTMLGDYHFRAEPWKFKAGEKGALELWGDGAAPWLTIGRDAEGRPISLERPTYPEPTTLRWLSAEELAKHFPG